MGTDWARNVNDSEFLREEEWIKWADREGQVRLLLDLNTGSFDGHRPISDGSRKLEHKKWPESPNESSQKVSSLQEP